MEKRAGACVIARELRFTEAMVTISKLSLVNRCSLWQRRWFPQLVALPAVDRHFRVDESGIQSIMRRS